MTLQFTDFRSPKRMTLREYPRLPEKNFQKKFAAVASGHGTDITGMWDGQLSRFVTVFVTEPCLGTLGKCCLFVSARGRND